jgi:predicted ATPase/signal transduction histidine kinase
MAFPLTGFRDARLLRASRNARVYEAVRKADGRSVIAKVFDLGPEDIESRVEHEFALLEALDVEGVVRALDFQRVGEQVVLLLEHIPGMDLASFADAQALESSQFMAIATALADILGRVHARRVIHRDIKPTNILIDPESGRVSLADFGISVLLESERRHIYDPAVIEGSLPYISPEQTGRTGRPVDFRSDLYSLGVTFYELLTGRRPFIHTAPLELIHAHLARMPESLRVHRPDLPDGLDRLVIKLLAKAPEHRYQTATGLAADLRALRELLAVDDEGASFVLGREDFARELQPPHQLYGREAERRELIDEFAAMRSGRARIMLLSGSPGIGKSALLAEIEAEAVRLGSYVARGRFDAERDRPYSAVIEAFAGLIEQLLTESESRLERWRERLLAALGGIARVVTELLPTLELVIGKQQPVAVLEPHEARNRVHLAIARFASVFCADACSLTLVLEDLQWSDASSLALLESLTEPGRQGSLLVLGSFREPDGPHPLRELIARLPNRRLRVIALGPMSSEAVEQLLADTLARAPSEVHELTRLVTRKTGNNPSFIHQLLGHLAEVGLVTPSEHGWTWDAAAIEAAEIPDDAVAVMNAKLATLSSGARGLLERAACIGDRFDLDGLRLVCDEPGAKPIAILHDLVDAGLINRVWGVGGVGRVGEYCFAHHGIREAAQSGAGLELRSRLRWRIGRHWQAVMDLHGPRLFEIVDHLEAGRASMGTLDPATSLELAELNLRAGRRALDSAAHVPALRYLDQGIDLVADLCEAVARRGEQAPHYQLIIDLHLARAQVLAFSGDDERSEQAFTSLLGWKLRVSDHGAVAARWVAQLNLRGRSDEAVGFGLEAMARHGRVLARAPSRLRSWLGLVWTWWRVRDIDTERFVAMPTCEDERASAAMQILSSTKNAAYVIDHDLYVALVSTHVLWILADGNHPSASLALAQLATCVGSRLGEVEGALRLGEVALALSERFDPGPTRVRVEAAVRLFVSPFGRPFAELLAHIDDICTRAIEVGDVLWAGYAGGLSLSMHLEIGTHLRVVRRHCERFEHELGSRVSYEARVVASTIHALTTVLVDPIDDEASTRARRSLDPERVEGRSRYSLFVTIGNRALAELLFGEAVTALTLCLQIVPALEQVMFGSWTIPRVALTTLVAAHALRDASESVPARASAATRKSLAIVRRWARGSHDNFGHYLDLAEGLRAARRGREREAMQLLERARAHAAHQGCRWIEGLAGEQLAELAERIGLTGFAMGARRQARDAYVAWGASAKPAQLAIADELVDVTVLESTSERPSSSTPRHVASARALDYDSVLRSVAAIGADLRLDQVVASVLDAAITNAGADHGLLVLEREGVLGLVARAEIDGERSVLAKPVPLDQAGDLGPISFVHFVLRTEQALVIDDAGADARFADDPYIRLANVQSLLGMPILKGKRTLGVLVLENRLSRYGFTPERLGALQLIAGQAASALDQARIHAALREGEARWRSLVDGAPDAIVLLDEDGEVEFVNRSGTPIASAGGPVVELFVGSPMLDAWREAVGSVLRDGVVRELELELPSERGPSIWYVARLAPIEVEREGASPGRRKAIVIATDITGRKRAEIVKHGLEAQVRQQQRLESIGTLAAGVAHEINNPIQGIMNYAELINENAREPTLVQEFADEISIESDRVATIVRNLLAFSRHEGDQPLMDVDLDALTHTTLSLIHAVMRKDQIVLRVAIGEGLPPARCRPQQIQQIIMNLVANARDALNAEYDGYDERKWIEIRAERFVRSDRSWLRLTVEDSGPGISSEVLPHIFDPFFTTKGRDQGTGLGLSVSHGIAREHGGDLSVDSRPGKGTRFFLDLPAGDL